MKRVVILSIVLGLFISSPCFAARPSKSSLPPRPARTGKYAKVQDFGQTKVDASGSQAGAPKKDFDSQTRDEQKKQKRKAKGRASRDSKDDEPGTGMAKARMKYEAVRDRAATETRFVAETAAFTGLSAVLLPLTLPVAAVGSLLFGLGPKGLLMPFVAGPVKSIENRKKRLMAKNIDRKARFLMRTGKGKDVKVPNRLKQEEDYWLDPVRNEGDEKYPEKNAKRELGLPDNFVKEDVERAYENQLALLRIGYKNESKGLDSAGKKQLQNHVKKEARMLKNLSKAAGDQTVSRTTKALDRFGMLDDFKGLDERKANEELAKYTKEDIDNRSQKALEKLLTEPGMNKKKAEKEVKQLRIRIEKEVKSAKKAVAEEEKNKQLEAQASKLDLTISPDFLTVDDIQNAHAAKAKQLQDDHDRLDSYKQLELLVQHDRDLKALDTAKQNLLKYKDEEKREERISSIKFGLGVVGPSIVSGTLATAVVAPVAGLSYALSPDEEGDAGDEQEDAGLEEQSE